MLVRLASISDAEAIRSIYNVEVETSTVTFDLVGRSLEEQESWLTARSGAHAAIVAEDAGHIVGFAALSPYKVRAAYATSVEDSVYVHRAHQGKRVGHLLLESLVERAQAHGFHAIFARIVADHDASIGLHMKHGFEIVGHEREVGRKFGRWLDVTVMERLLT